MTPCCTSSEATSTNGSPRTQATTVESLKKTVRGFLGLMICCCRLVFEKTTICDSTGISNAFSVDRRYPDGPPNVSQSFPSWRLAFNADTELCTGRVTY